MHGIIFDMDGVLVLTGPAHYQAWRTVAAGDGIELDYETFTHTFGRTNPDVIRVIWGRVPPQRVAAIADQKERAFRDIIASDVPLAPGLVPLLESLASAGLVLSIGSSAPPQNIDLVLDCGDLRRFFASIADGSQVTRGKPAPDVFLLAARLAGLAPERCAVVEDAPAGIAAAVSAGMHPIGVTTTHSGDDLRRAGAAVILDALTDLEPGMARGGR